MSLLSEMQELKAKKVTKKVRITVEVDANYASVLEELKRDLGKETGIVFEEVFVEKVMKKERPLFEKLQKELRTFREKKNEKYVESEVKSDTNMSEEV